MRTSGAGWAMWRGDCLDVMRGLDLETFALVIADPPYGVAERTDRGSKGRGIGKGRTRAIDWAPVLGDDRPFDPAPFVVLPRVVLWGANHFASRLPDASCWLAWDKRAGGSSDDNADCELAWTNLKGPARLFSHLWRGMITASEKTQKLHPTQKPVALMRWIIERWTKPGDVILDPYAGSAPVGAACLRTGRGYVGIELDPKHYDTACNRLHAEESDSTVGAIQSGQLPLMGGVK